MVKQGRSDSIGRLLQFRPSLWTGQQPKSVKPLPNWVNPNGLIGTEGAKFRRRGPDCGNARDHLKEFR